MTEPLASEDRHQAIQNRIQGVILARELQRGDPLPSETQLARILGVSRNSLREAIRSLQTLGVVETRHGFGTFVGAVSLNPLVRGLVFQAQVDGAGNLRVARELLELRQVLEAGLIPRVVARCGDAHLAELRALVDRMEERARRGEHFTEEDRLFHQALYTPLDNQLLTQLLEVFWRVLHSVRAQLPGTGPDEPVRIAAGHRMIVDAVASRDGARASEIMTLHFAGMRAWINDATVVD